MAHLQLVVVAAPLLSSGTPVVLATLDPAGGCAACTTNGMLHLLPAAHATPNGIHASTTTAFAVTLLAPERQARQLGLPWAALHLLPDRGGLLFAQRGSGRLLFCQHPVGLDPGQAADIFLLGSHEAPITSITASPCGGLALSTDVQGGLALWDLGDGTQLAAAQSGSSGSVIAACWLQDVTLPAPTLIATAQQCSSVMQLWSTGAAGNLRLVGELDAGRSRAVTVLATAGPLLAVGCSDGSTLLWHRSGDGEFVQKVMLAGAVGGAPVVALAFSGDAALVAAATTVAGGAAAAVFRAASGHELVCHHMLPAPPALLYWSRGSGELLAVLKDGSRLSFGSPDGEPPSAVEQQQPPFQQEQQELQQQQPFQQEHVAVEPARKQKKMVRFAAAEAAGGASLRSAAWTAAAVPPEPGIRSCVLQPTPAAHGPTWRMPDSRSSSSRSSMRVASSRPELPPLPTHPLLQGGSSGGARVGELDNFQPSDNLLFSEPTSAAPNQIGGGGGSMSDATAASGGFGSSHRRPLYPILDFRALQGLPSKAAGCVWPAASQPPASRAAAAPGNACSQPTSPAKPSIKPAEPVAQAGAGPTAASAARGAGPPSIGEEQQEVVAEGDEAPRQRCPPTPMQRRQVVEEEEPRSPGRVSKQRCEACVTLAAVAARDCALAPGQSGLHATAKLDSTSPVKAALLVRVAGLAEEVAACVAAPAQPAASDCAGGGSRVASPCRLSVAWPEAQQQQQGQEELLNARVAAARQQRYALLSRRVVRRSERQHPVQEQQAPVFAAVMEQQQAGGSAGQVPPKSVTAQQQQEKQDVEFAAVDPAAAGPAVAGAHSSPQQEAAIDVSPAGVNLHAAAPVLVEAAAGGSAGGSFAIASDTELSEGEDEVAPAWDEAWHCRTTAAAEEEAGSPRPLLEAPSVHPQLLSALPVPEPVQARCGVQPAAATPPVAAVPAAAAEQQGDVQQQVQVRYVSGTLAATWPPAGRRLEARISVKAQQQETAGHAAPHALCLAVAEMLTARRKAATATTTLPRNAHMFSDLPPLAPPDPSAVPGGSGKGRASPRRATALAGARKHLDERWVAEQRELHPALAQLWSPPAERLRRQHDAAAVASLPVSAPLPCGRQLVAHVLGLRL